MRQCLAPDADDRPAAPPGWRWSQHWGDVLFLHWAVPAAAVRVPVPLEIDAFDGAAWVSVVIFRLRTRARGLPFLPGMSELAEVNVRTYVRHRGRPGVWFLSIHADNRWAAGLARLLTPLPYAHAPLSYCRRGDGFEFEAWPGTSAGSALTCRPTGGDPEPGGCPPDDWFLERYRVFAPDRRGRLMEADVAHPRWVTRGVEVKIAANGFGRAAGLDLSGTPDRAQFSPGVWARFGAFRPAEGVARTRPLPRGVRALGEPGG